MNYLREDGSIYVHLDWHVGHYAKAVLDEVFGYSRFRNEIVWQRFNYHADARRYGIVHEGILFYSKADGYVWNPQVSPFKASYIDSHFTMRDENGRVYRLDNMLAKGNGPPRRFGDRVLAPKPGTHWRYGQDKIDELWSQGRIVISEAGRASVKRYLDEIEGAVVHSHLDGYQAH